MAQETETERLEWLPWYNPASKCDCWLNPRSYNPQANGFAASPPVFTAFSTDLPGPNFIDILQEPNMHFHHHNGFHNRPSKKLSTCCLESKTTFTWGLDLTLIFLIPILEKAIAPHSSTLAWKIPWTEEPGGLQSMGSLRVGSDWLTSLSLFAFMHWRRNW